MGLVGRCCNAGLAISSNDIWVRCVAGSGTFAIRYIRDAGAHVYSFERVCIGIRLERGLHILKCMAR